MKLFYSVIFCSEVYFNSTGCKERNEKGEANIFEFSKTRPIFFPQHDFYEYAYIGNSLPELFKPVPVHQTGLYS